MPSNGKYHSELIRAVTSGLNEATESIVLSDGLSLLVAFEVERVVLEHSPKVKEMRERIKELRDQFIQSCNEDCPCKAKSEDAGLSMPDAGML